MTGDLKGYQMQGATVSETPGALRFVERHTPRGDTMHVARILQQQWILKIHDLDNSDRSRLTTEWRDVPLVLDENDGS